MIQGKFLLRGCQLLLLVGCAYLLSSAPLRSSQPPADPSPVILDMVWAAPNTIRYAGQDSDSWVTTWADDNELYIAYGDGFGFVPKLDHKVSMGYAKVSGSPTNFTGTNIPSADEQFGDSRTGKKPASMLMVDGVLYIWVRNADNNGKECQIAWSTDHGQNWQWNDWTFPEFGYCAFINYGKNYDNARDEYVYMVSHNYFHAYVYKDDFILTRVPKDKIRQRSAYEFFVSRNSDGSANWSSSVNSRGVVFSHPGNARRSSITYNAGIGRYLWWQNLAPESSEVDIRQEGGFAIFDAPEPWGPWTTAYYTEQWDVGPGELGVFPAKWISADGKTIYLVSSTNDAFAVRRADLTIAADQSTATPTHTPEDTPLPTITLTPTSVVTATVTSSPAATEGTTVTATPTHAPTSIEIPSATPSSTIAPPATRPATVQPTTVPPTTVPPTTVPPTTVPSTATISVTAAPMATGTLTPTGSSTQVSTPETSTPEASTPLPLEQQFPHAQYLPFVLR